MEIAIIGAGNVGKALASSSVRAGHGVVLSATDPEHAQAAAEATGARAAASNAEAVRGADVVILAVPNTAVDEVVDELGDALDGKVVVDATNRLNPSDPSQTLDGTSMAERVQGRRPAARVVKAFNTLMSSRMADPPVAGVQPDGYVAGDDGEAKAAVLQLVESLGFRPIDAGPLALARTLEGMAVLNILLNMRNGWPWQGAFRLVGATGEGI